MDTNTASNDVEAAIISKIEALFRQANHPNTGAHEREAFHAKALALMAKHRISEVELGTDETETPDDYDFGLLKGSYSVANWQIVASVASIYGVKTWGRRIGRPGDPTKRIYLFGFKRDAERVKLLANEFMLDAKAQAGAYKSTPHYPGDRTASDRTTNWRKSFMMGYAAEVRTRYAEAKRMLDDEQPGWATTGSALVLVSREKQVADAYAAKTNLRRGGRRRMQGFNPNGYASGQEAARNSNVGRARIGGSGRAIGAGS